MRAGAEFWGLGVSGRKTPVFIRVHLWIVLLLCGGFSPAWAAFPQVGSTNTSVTTPASTNHVISLPSGISSGNLLLAMWGVDDATDGTWPTGWTEIVATTLPSNTGRLEVAYRIADGTEGTTITVTSISKTSSHITYRITGYSGTPQTGTTASGTSTNANPPSVTPRGELRRRCGLRWVQWMGPTLRRHQRTTQTC